MGIVKGQPFNPDERMQRILMREQNLGSACAWRLCLHGLNDYYQAYN
jgi:hypothetical protein